MKKKRILFLLLACWFPAWMVMSQETKNNINPLADQLIQFKKTNDELKHHYTWNVRTDVTKEGKVLDIQIQQAKFGPDGKVALTLINDQGAHMPTSFLIHQIAEEEKAKMQKFFEGLHAFLEQYAFPNETSIFYFLDKAIISTEDPNGLILMAGQNIIIPGDRLNIWLNKDKYTSDKLSVSTTFEGSQVEFTATFNTLPTGLNYMSFAEVLIPDKSMTLMVHWYDYMKLD